MINIEELRWIIKNQEQHPDRNRLSQIVDDFYLNLQNQLEDYFAGKKEDFGKIRQLKAEREELTNRESADWFEIAGQFLNIETLRLKASGMIAFGAVKRKEWEIERQELQAKIDDYNEKVNQTNKYNELSKMIKSSYNDIEIGLKSLGVKLSYDLITHKDDYLCTKTLSGPGPGAVEKILWENWGDFLLNEKNVIYLSNTQKLKMVDENSKRLQDIEIEQLEDAINRALDEDFKAAYLCPAQAPSKFEFRKRGRWTYIDQYQINSSETKDIVQKIFLDINPKSNFVVHDLTESNLPDELKQGTFDLIFYNADWAKNGATPKCASRLCKKDRMIITRRHNSDQINHLNLGLELLADYRFAGYSIYIKK